MQAAQLAQHNKVVLPRGQDIQKATVWVHLFGIRSLFTAVWIQGEIVSDPYRV
jgi:hypothetical protein